MTGSSAAASVMWPALLALVASPAYAQSVWIAQGSVFYRDRAGHTRQLTHSRSDEGPVLAPNGNQVAFLRTVAGEKIRAACGDVDPQEIRIMKVDGTYERRLVSSLRDPDHASDRAALRDLKFSPTGQELFFMSQCAVVSGCLHKVDIRSRKTRMLSDCNGYEVLRCGRHKGDLLVVLHRYSEGGSYEEAWLMRANGLLVRDVGSGDGDEFQKTVRRFMAGDGCDSEAARPNRVLQPTPREGAAER